MSIPHTSDNPLISDLQRYQRRLSKDLQLHMTSEKRRFRLFSSSQSKSSSNNSSRADGGLNSQPSGNGNDLDEQDFSPIMKGYKECLNATKSASEAVRKSFACANVENGSTGTAASSNSTNNGLRTPTAVTDEKKIRGGTNDSSFASSFDCVGNGLGGTSNKTSIIGRTRLNSLGKTPKTTNTSSCMNENAKPKSSSPTSSSGRHEIPGIILLMDQNNWSRVNQRAKKYKRECKKTVYLPKDRNRLKRGRSDASSSSVGLSKSFASQTTTASTRTVHHKNSAQVESDKVVKCKALHHACHCLRRVHAHIRKCISESLKVEIHSPRKNSSRTFTSSAPSFDSSGDDMYRLSSHSFESFASTSSNQQYDGVEWDDPWIEACKAILTIIEQYPEAAEMRESRHGCLPIHLAAFAMGPTPDVNSVEEMYATLGKSIHGEKKTFSLQDLPPPRPISQSRRVTSSCSTGGSSTGTSMDGFSVNLEKELHLGPSSNGRRLHSSSSYDSSCPLERMEAQLRASAKNKLDNFDEDRVLSSARSLFNAEKSSIPRPPNLNSLNGDMYRSSSIGSQTSTCSNSVMSAASTVAPYAPSPKYRNFDLRKYIANEARREEYSLRVLNALLDAYPRGVKEDSEGGRLPLHTAIAGKASLKVIETIARAYPDACRCRNFENSLPIHLAAVYGVSDPDIIPMLLRHYPYATVGRNRFERTPYEEAFLQAGENGREHQEEILRALAKPPEHWNTETRHLHTENQWGQDFGASIDHLLEGEYKSTGRAKAPQDQRRVDTNDLFDLIRARQWDYIVDNIDILQCQAEKRRNVDVRGGYNARVSALYFACEHNPTYDIVEALVNACPDSIGWKKHPGGEYPLHAACSWSSSSCVVGFLLAASPDVARIQDYAGNLPLHSACYSGAPKKIVESLIMTNPRAVDVTNAINFSPIDIVRKLSHGNRNEILHYIEEVSLEVLRKKREREFERERREKERREQDRLRELENENNKMEDIGNSSKGKKKWFSKKDKNNDISNQENESTERKTNITNSPPPKESIEVEPARDSDNGNLVWV